MRQKKTAQVTFRIDPNLKEAAGKAAALERRSLTSFLTLRGSVSPLNRDDAAALGAMSRFTLHENGSLAPSPAFCDRKFEIVTPTSRMPLGGGKTDRIRPRATSCSLSLVSMLVSIDRLRVDI
jgi:hypothetical protein